MAELATVREPEWLKERRSVAATRAAALDLPRFKGKAGWEFTDITKLDLAAFTAVDLRPSPSLFMRRAS